MHEGIVPSAKALHKLSTTQDNSSSNYSVTRAFAVKLMLMFSEFPGGPRLSYFTYFFSCQYPTGLKANLSPDSASAIKRVAMRPVQPV